MTGTEPLRILVPLDGSWVAESVLDWAKNFAERSGAHLVLFRVDLPLRASVFMATLMGNDRSDDAPGPAKEYMEGLESILCNEGASVSAEVAHAELLDRTVADTRTLLAECIGRVVADRIAQDDIDLAIVASHGLTADPSVRWGGVCQAIIAKSTKPVVFVPARLD